MDRRLDAGDRENLRWMVDSVDARPSPQLTREKRTGTMSLGIRAPICEPER